MATVLVDNALSQSRGTRRRWFYVAVSLLITVTALAGFGPSFYESLVLGVSRHWTIHAHAAVFLGWLALLIGQAVLAARGQIALHRRIGNFGIAYGIAVLILGFVVGFAVPATYVEAGTWTLDRAASFLATILADMVLFGGFFGAAIAYRGRPEVHKRLMLLAAVALILPGVARLWFIEARFAGGPNAAALGTLLFVWLVPLFAAMAYDFATARRIHPVYWTGVAISVLSIARFPLSQTESWRVFGRAFLAPML